MKKYRLKYNTEPGLAEWEYYYFFGQTAAKLKLGIQAYKGPQEWAQAWTRGYLAFLYSKEFSQKTPEMAER